MGPKYKACDPRVAVLLYACIFACSANAETIDPTVGPSSEMVTSELTSFIQDKWFFIEPMHQFQTMARRTGELVVHEGENFGVEVKFAKKIGNVKFVVKLIVPSHSENFPCSICKPGELSIIDEHTVVVTHDVDEIKGKAGFYWGIGPGDPLGQYEMSFSINGLPFETYKFKAVKAGTK